MSDKFDIHIEGMPLGVATSVRSITFGAYPRSLGVRGPQKMVDRFLKCLMTPIGSDLSDPEYGTPLAAALLRSTVPEALQSLAVRSVAAAEEKIREYDSTYGLPERERLRSVRIDQIHIDSEGQGVVLELTLENTAGEVVKTLLPQIVGT